MTTTKYTQVEQIINRMITDKTGYLSFDRGFYGHGSLTWRGLNIGGYLGTPITPVKPEEIKVTLSKCGNIELRRKSNNELLVNLGANPEVEWAEYTH